MNPHQKNKIDISSLSADEQRLFRLYGKLPNKKDLLQNKLKERKYFDSGDYAMSKAGKSNDAGLSSLGTQHPLPENIPHLTTPVTGPNGAGGNGVPTPAPGGQSGSPVKESSFLHRETSADEVELEQQQQAAEKVPQGSAGRTARPDDAEPSVSPPPKREGVPIRWQS
ncbi:MAG: hypothetical protein M1814_006812 [Vezdaea aestivalis]|nr:MAG: hypothetical protein M1814_006812 [Vezdaea aestivalis]